MFDLEQARQMLLDQYEFIEIESEGDDCFRVDYGDNSVWIYRDGSTEGLTTMPKSIQYFIQRFEGIK
jgi:hypothetical protein